MTADWKGGALIVSRRVRPTFRKGLSVRQVDDAPTAPRDPSREGALRHRHAEPGGDPAGQWLESSGRTGHGTPGCPYGNPSPRLQPSGLAGVWETRRRASNGMPATRGIAGRARTRTVGRNQEVGLGHPIDRDWVGIISKH